MLRSSPVSDLPKFAWLGVPRVRAMSEDRYESEARLRARWRRTLSRLPQSRESHHLRLPLRLSSRNTQPQPSPAQTLTLPSFGDVKSSAADCATGHNGLSSRVPPSSPLRSQPQP